MDKTSYDTTSDSDKPVHVSAIAATSASSIDISIPQDRALPQNHMVAVGRSDGSVFMVKLGDSYLTQFMPVPKLVVEGEEEDDVSVRVDQEWMDSDELKKSLQDEGKPSQGTSDEDRTTQTQSPFEISYQFQASEQGEAINKLVYHDNIEGSDGVICSAAGTAGDISIWKVTDKQIIQSAVLSGIHRGPIVALETLVIKDKSVLFSASQDGSFALWNLDKNGELVTSHHCMDANSGSPIPLSCADVYNPSSLDDGYGNNDNDNNVIFLASPDGYVMGYVIQESPAGDISFNPGPNMRYKAHETAVTAIKCGGEGTIPASARLRQSDDSQANTSPRVSSSILITGGEDGSVKQWEILSQKDQSSTGVRLEHWPRLSTQRMKRRAHLFSPSHDGAVTCISQQSMNDSSKFLTASDDGSVSVWSATSGKELFSMDGFNNLSSLVFIGREILVTDGMEQYVCVHDFGIPEDAAKREDLDW